MKALALLLAGAGIGYVAGNANTDQEALKALRAQQTATSKKLDAALNALAAPQGITANTLVGRGLKNPDKLPGTGSDVTDEQRRKLAASTVAIITRPKANLSYYWHATCSGTKVSIDDNPYILTAQHCLDSGYTSPRVQPHTFAADVLPSDARAYAIARATTDSIKDNRTPVAEVTAASVIVGGKYRPDMALMKVSPVTEGDGAGIYGKIPAIPLKDYALRPPEPGSEAAFYGVPAAISKVAVGGIGTYLGRIQPEEGHPYKLDVFGFNMTDVRQDPVQFGSSGSGAIGANGHMFGTLSERSTQKDETRTPLTVLPSPYEKLYGLQISDELGIDTGPYTVLAGTTVPPRYVFEELVSGFDHHLAGVE
jgi:hypothetical protein